MFGAVCNKQRMLFLLKPQKHGKDSELEIQHSILFHSECEILYCPGIINLSDRQLPLLGQFALCPQAEGALLCRRLMPVPGGVQWSCLLAELPRAVRGLVTTWKTQSFYWAWLGWSSSPHSILTGLGCVLAPKKGLVTLFINYLYLDQVWGFFLILFSHPHPAEEVSDKSSLVGK